MDFIGFQRGLNVLLWFPTLIYLKKTNHKRFKRESEAKRDADDDEQVDSTIKPRWPWLGFFLLTCWSSIAPLQVDVDGHKSKSHWRRRRRRRRRLRCRRRRRRCRRRRRYQLNLQQEKKIISVYHKERKIRLGPYLEEEDEIILWKPMAAILKRPEWMMID